MISARSLLIATIVLHSTATHVFAQEPPADRTVGEQAAGAAVGAIDITIGGVAHQVVFQENEAGEAIYQGDIVLGPAAALQAADGVSLQDLDDDILFGLAIRNRENAMARWQRALPHQSPTSAIPAAYTAPSPSGRP